LEFVDKLINGVEFIETKRNSFFSIQGRKRRLYFNASNNNPISNTEIDVTKMGTVFK
jgi:hypothetical protein